jgi:hypothetical protein
MLVYAMLHLAMIRPDHVEQHRRVSLLWSPVSSIFWPLLDLGSIGIIKCIIK